MEEHLEPEIAQFLLQVMQPIGVTGHDLVDGLEDLIRLLQQVRTQRGVRLRLIPGTVLAQALHQLHRLL